jgi:hypothetical protein
MIPRTKINISELYPEGQAKNIPTKRLSRDFYSAGGYNPILTM